MTDRLRLVCLPPALRLSIETSRCPPVRLHLPRKGPAMTTTITREQGGWTTTCDRCPWLYHARVLAEVHRRRRWHVCEEVA